MLEQVTDEVVALHVDFERWFAGSLPTLERVEAVLGDEFFFVGPTGTAVDRTGVLGFIGAAKGAQQVSIRIENVAIRWHRGDLVGASYEEWQTERSAGGSETTTGRLSSAVFEVEPSLPGGLRWLSVHETWLPGAGPAIHSNES